MSSGFFLLTNTVMKIQVLQHANGEGLGSLRQWFLEKGAHISTIRIDLNQDLPKLNEFDWLIILGGPMGAYEEDKYSWLKTEKKFIRAVIESNKRVLGICLGAQLIASAMGARVYPNKQKEIGWFPIKKTNQVATWLSSDRTLLCWHGDCFDLPEAATSFATSEITEHQGFCLGPRVWALQFHIEAIHGTTDIFFKVSGSSLPEGDYVQSLTSLSLSKHLPTSQKTAFKLLDFIHTH
jgi:GMP synthase (glutamine-hydrolysing)